VEVIEYYGLSIFFRGKGEEEMEGKESQRDETDGANDASYFFVGRG
jgi:hypothetical protein